ncbi:MAG: glutathione S-transferase N-terminal domain-containing protein [Pseudomonadota bacterium]
MYILYIEQGCPFGERVMAFMKKHGIKAELRDRDIGNYAQELIARGGKRQTPYLVDEEAGVEMYESADIIDYLSRKLGII